MLTNEQLICLKAAKVLAGKEIYKLSVAEKTLVKDLEKGGYLEENPTPKGFVGKETKPNSMGDSSQFQTREEKL